MYKDMLEDFLKCLNVYFKNQQKIEKNNIGNIEIKYIEYYDRIPEFIGAINGKSPATFDIMFPNSSGNYVQYITDDNKFSIVGFFDTSTENNNHQNIFHVYNGKTKIFSFLDKTGDILVNDKILYNIKNLTEEDFDFYIELKN